VPRRKTGKSKTKTEKRKAARRKPRVAKLSPDVEAARDEGPRLIPLPDVNSPVSTRASDPGGLPTNRYVALADLALRLWNPPAGENGKPEPPPSPRRPRR
jgi:hypothetical protein